MRDIRLSIILILEKFENISILKGFSFFLFLTRGYFFTDTLYKFIEIYLKTYWGISLTFILSNYTIRSF